MNKSTVLQDYNGNNIYPIIPYQNVFGLPSASGKRKIFFGDGKPNSIRSNYKDVEVNDIYINTDVQNRQGYFYIVTSTPGEVIAWTRTYGFYTIQNIDAPNSYSIYYSLDVPNHRPGIIWLNITNNKIFVCTGSDSSGPTWKELTDFYTKSEVNALFNELQFKINKKAKPVVETVTGSPITLEDSSNRDIKKLTLYGKSEQIKTNGYQLLEKIIAGVTETSRGITFEYKSEGKIHISGTLTGTTNLDLWLTPNSPIGQGQYYAKGKGFTNSVTFTFVRSGMAEQTGDFSQAFNLTTDTTYPVRLQIKAGSTNLNLEVQVMVESGTTSHAFESYTGGKPSPSLDYPQNIEDINQENINILKKNLLPKTELTKTTLATNNISSYIYNNGELEVTPRANGFISIGNISWNKKGEYYDRDGTTCIRVPVKGYNQIYYKIKNGNLTSAIIFINKDNIAVSNRYYPSVNGNTYSVPADADYLIVNLNKSNAVAGETIRDNLLIVPTDLSLDYEEPINPQTANLTKTLRGIPVSSGGNYTDQNGQQWICDTIERYKDGSGKLIQRIGSYTVTENTYCNCVNPWATHQNTSIFRISNTNYPMKSQTLAYSNMFIGRIRNWTYDNESVASEGNNALDFRVLNSRLGVTGDEERDVLSQALKTYMHDNNLEFNFTVILPEPIETPLTAEELAQLDLSTYKPITNIVSNIDATVTYVADTKNYIDKRMTELQNAIISQGGNV